jgi:hypothetical protein
VKQVLGTPTLATSIGNQLSYNSKTLHRRIIYLNSFPHRGRQSVEVLRFKKQKTMMVANAPFIVFLISDGKDMSFSYNKQ